MQKSNIFWNSSAYCFITKWKSKNSSLGFVVVLDNEKSNWKSYILIFVIPCRIN